MKRKAVFVIDMQNDFIDGSLGSEYAQAIVPNVKAAIEYYKQDGATLIFTMDTHNKDYRNTHEGKLLPIDHCIEKTDGWKLNDIVMSSVGNYGNKRTYLKTNFAYNWFNVLSFNFLRAKTYDQVVIFGLCTDICVISNALIIRAALPDAEIICISDCCAGTTPEKHAAALEVMESCQIEVKTLKEVVEKEE